MNSVLSVVLAILFDDGIWSSEASCQKMAVQFRAQFCPVTA